jgi:hypothetical protein
LPPTLPRRFIRPTTASTPPIIRKGASRRHADTDVAAPVF